MTKIEETLNVIIVFNEKNDCDMARLIDLIPSDHHKALELTEISNEVRLRCSVQRALLDYLCALNTSREIAEDSSINEDKK